VKVLCCAASAAMSINSSWPYLPRTDDDKGLARVSPDLRYLDGASARADDVLLPVLPYRPMERTEGHIPWSGVESRLASLREIWVATASARGRPDAVPAWFWWGAGAAYFTCAASSRKARNIGHEPEVVLHNGDGADPIILKGRAERITVRAELERVDDAYRQKYVDPHTGARATIFIADDHVYRVRPRLVMAWSYATMTTRTVWRAQ
jgi:nitroimidazol reductase NimA-like FMN-containing flavoprotein (pyridoxamine 5'-phosphate oxidase superfamily)